MLDAPLRKLVTPLLKMIGSWSVALPVSANQFTWGGFAVGMLGCVAIAFGFYIIGLVFIVANRLIDVIDGSVARQKGITDYGGYIDIVLDFFFYSAVPCAFAFASPDNALAASVLILSFVGTGSSFLTFAIICAKRKIDTNERGKKSFYYLGGLMESTETTIFFVAFCLFPAYFSVLAYIFAAICLLTFAMRLYAASQQFSS